MVRTHEKVLRWIAGALGGFFAFVDLNLLASRQ
jgi:hypothetical protein